MTRILFVSAPLPGHMDWGGMHRTAVALLARGHDVRWATEPYGFPHLERLGIPTFALPTTGWLWPPPPMPANLSPQARARERQRRAVAVWLDPERVLPATEALLDLVRQWQPDLLVSEPFMAAAAFAAELAEVPLVIAGWPATEMPTRVPPHQAEAARLAQAWRRTMEQRLSVRGTYWAPGPLPWLRSPHLHIAYFTREWYATWRVLIPPTLLVGGMPPQPGGTPPAWMRALPEDRPWALITLGSAFTQDEAFFLRAATVAHKLGAQVILATGDQALAERLRAALPADIHVATWVPFAHLFPRLRLVIHHGGVGTTHAALVHAVPQLVVPHAADQYYQAARVQRTGVGLALRVEQVRTPALEDALVTLLEDSHWRRRAQAVAEQMASLGGVERAATAVEALLAGTSPEQC